MQASIVTVAIIAVAFFVGTAAMAHDRPIAAIDGGDLELHVGIDRYLGSVIPCDSSNLSVTTGDIVVFCYYLTNHSGQEVDYQTISDTYNGIFKSHFFFPIADGDDSVLVNAGSIAGPENGGEIIATWTAETSPTDYTYAIENTSSFIDISTTGTPLNLTDPSSTAVTMPFSVTYYGQTSSQLCVDNFGGMVFGSSSCALPPFGAQLPVSNLGGAAILPFWTGLHNSGNVFTESIGSAPNRQFVVEWYQKNHIDGFDDDPGNVTFEVVLDEDGTLSFRYLDTTFDNPDHPEWDYGGDASVGLENANGSLYTQFSYAMAALSDGLEIDWSPPPAPASFTTTATATLDVGAPAIAVDPITIAASVDSGASITLLLTIDNSAGTRPLTWSVGAIPAQDASSRSTAAQLSRQQIDMGVSVQEFGSTVDASLPASAAPALLAHGARHRFFENAPSVVPAPAGSGVTPAQVPAYAMTNYYNTYLYFDASDPDGSHLQGPLVNIGPRPGDYVGGTFIDNDFSKEYLLNYHNGFATIDTVTGEVTTINPDTSPSRGLQWSSMDWDASTGVLYAYATSSTFGSRLYTIDPTTGVSTPVGSGDAGIGILVGAMAIDDRDGQIYAVDVLNDDFVSIDKTTGEYSVIGPIGFDANNTQGLDFDASTGTLWYTGFDGFMGGMYTIDVGTGAATYYGATQLLDELYAFAIAVPSGDCAHAEDIPWLNITPSGGITDVGTTSQVTVTLDAATLSDGIYHADLCIASDDRTRRTLSVPVTFTVGDAPTDIIFTNGFELGGVT